jgi:hypothetical protein
MLGIASRQAKKPAQTVTSERRTNTTTQLVIVIAISAMAQPTFSDDTTRLR